MGQGCEGERKWASMPQQARDEKFHHCLRLRLQGHFSKNLTRWFRLWTTILATGNMTWHIFAKILLSFSTLKVRKWTKVISVWSTYESIICQTLEGTKDWSHKCTGRRIPVERPSPVKENVSSYPKASISLEGPHKDRIMEKTTEALKQEEIC